MLSWFYFYSYTLGYCCSSSAAKSTAGSYPAHCLLNPKTTYSRAAPQQSQSISSLCCCHWFSLSRGRTLHFSLSNFMRLLLIVPSGYPDPSVHSPSLDHIVCTHIWVSAAKLPVSLGSLFSLFTISLFLDPICFYVNCLLITRSITLCSAVRAGKQKSPCFNPDHTPSCTILSHS